MSSSDTTHLPLMCESLPKKYRLKAERELNETEGKLAEGVQKLKNFIERESLQLDMDDEFLVSFLRTAKFDMKKAEQRLKRFVSMIRTIIDILSNTEMERIRNVIDHQMTGLLPYRDEEGRAVIYTLAYAWEKELFDLKDVAACMMSLVVFISSYPLTSVCGLTYICEAKFNSIYDLLPIGNAIRIHTPFVNAYPARLQKVEVLNENSIVRFLHMAIRPLLPHKLAKRVRLHKSDSELLFKDYPPSVRPLEFGGTLGPLNNECYREKFLQFIQNLKEGSIKIDRTGASSPEARN